MKYTMHNRGFTIVEALVAITVLILGITGALTAASTGITTSTYAKEDIIAVNLAQAAVEQIRNMRDANGINHQYWLQGIAGSGDPCELDNAACAVTLNSFFGSQPLIRCPDFGACPPVRFDPSSGEYGYDSSWNMTPYTEEVDMWTRQGGGTILDRNQEVGITVKITWMHGTTARHYEVRENLFNWQS